ncbi:gluconokinase [Microbacterium hydrocarbonoxydans]|uniref:gluconokinase n=1 Tax=Microbacterium hydrocarbonoxydans TaxID=273678 RepID=UPI00203E332F|nr:gluconokinase [Microbacterium hydrocarbonoxydans]MCM3779672.1 gluconokinase [Microbacterium hydrocarbonoxydans]
MAAQAPVLVLMGVAGTGKSTVAAMLAGRLGWTFEEGDDLHPEANVKKMASGDPLTDDDRWPWLDRIAEWIDERIAAGEPGIITCSALKRSYRDVLRRDAVTFVHFVGDRELILERMLRRQGHFMPTTLLDSQFATLEPLGADEKAIEVAIDQTPQQQTAEIATRLRLLADY